MNLEAFLHGRWFNEEDNRMNDQVVNSSLDSGVFSDDESRDTVCLSPYQELLSSGDESFSLTPEDPESRHQRMSSGEVRHRHTSGEMPETPGVAELPVSGCQSPREPFYDIGLQRSSSLENTLFHLGFCEQTVDRSFISPGQSIEKENLPASGTVQRRRSSTKRKIDDVSDAPWEANNTERCAMPKETDTDQISMKRKRKYVGCAVEALDTQQPLKMKFSLKQKQSDEDLNPETKLWTPEIVDHTPSRLIRLKCLSPGEAFKQKRLSVIDEGRQTTSPLTTDFLNLSKNHQERGHFSEVEALQFPTPEVTISQCSSSKDVMSKDSFPESGMSQHISLATSSECFFSEPKPSTSTGICEDIGEKNDKTYENTVYPNRIAKRRRPVEISSTPKVVKQEPIFKIPEMLPPRKWSTKPIRGRQVKKVKQNVYTKGS
ncbi:uncharacterized protein [Palaemon carinicauda]|uniref:uncharacterized protein n=1 Tax=Palaemon carinicauda TaxID=392227 RepID=UPI0035B6118D